jgi:hypothetical protein
MRQNPFFHNRLFILGQPPRVYSTHPALFCPSAIAMVHTTNYELMGWQGNLFISILFFHRKKLN